MSVFAADTRLDAQVLPSPNHGQRRSSVPLDMLILHYTGMHDGRAALQWLCSPESEVSAHYLVFEDGGIVQCVPESRRAWHAGVASWKGIADVNSRSVGIEIANPGHDGGYPDFPAPQIESVIALCRDILERHPISADFVLAHSDVAPLRKQDPGEKFPWGMLHEAGIGHWVAPIAKSNEATLNIGSCGRAVQTLRANLHHYGYAIAPGEDYDTSVATVVQAFQRHFRPSQVDGVADFSTQTTLQRLLDSRPMRRRCD